MSYPIYHSVSRCIYSLILYYIYVTFNLLFNVFDLPLSVIFDLPLSVIFHLPQSARFHLPLSSIPSTVQCHIPYTTQAHISNLRLSVIFHLPFVISHLSLSVIYHIPRTATFSITFTYRTQCHIIPSTTSSYSIYHSASHLPLTSIPHLPCSLSAT